MKTTKIHIIILTLLFSLSLQAQTTSTSEGNGVFDGLVNTLHDVKDDVIETVSDVKDKLNDVKDKNKENIEKLEFALNFRKGDIRLIMTGDKNKEWKNITETHGTNTVGFYYLDLGDNSLEIKFDWDNRALIMEGESSGYSFGQYDNQGLAEIFGKKEKKLVQYTDKDGNWYTPVKDMEQPYEKIEYIKFNAKQMAVDGLNGVLDLNSWLKANSMKLAALLAVIESSIDWKLLGIYDEEGEDDDRAGSLYAISLFEEYFGKNRDELVNGSEELIKMILSKELEEIGGFPIFIHWAFFYSPEYISTHYGNKVDKETFDCDGYANACSKFTVLQGPDKGKSMEFDRLGRLTFINSLKDGTAQFFYDKDITVTLPDPNVVMDMSSMMSDIFKQRNMEDNYREQKEELLEEIRKETEKFNKRKEAIEYLKKKISELEVKKEQAITKKDRDEYQEILDELKKILDKETKRY